MPDQDKGHQDTATRRERELLQALLVVFRSCGLYPDTHARVESSVGRVLELVAQLLDGAEALPVIMTRREVRVGARRLPPAEAGCDWLIESCERTALAGVCFSGAAGRAELLQFARLLLRNRSNRNRSETFARLWAGSWKGVWPVERRFDGTFDAGAALPGDLAQGMGTGPALRSGAEHQWLRETLRRDPEVRARLDELQAALDIQAAPSGPRQGGDLIDALVSQMPAEAWKDESFARQLALQALGVVGAAVVDNRPNTAPGLTDRLLGIARSFFGSRAQPEPPAAAPASAGPTGHAGDELITDDAAALRIELEALPKPSAESMAQLGATSTAEILAIHLHLLLELEDPKRRERLVASLREHAGASTPAEQAVLAPYLDPSRLGAELPRKAAALVHTLLAGGLKAVLFKSNVPSAGLLRAALPGCLVDLLDAIDPSRPEECEYLGRLVQEIGKVRLAHAEEALAQAGALFRPDRLDKLFALVRAELLPLVELVLRRDQSPATPARVVTYLRTLKPEHRAKTPLWVVDSAQLPRKFLCELCEGLAGGSVPAPLVDHAAALIRRFVDQTAGDEQLAVRREYAIASLGQFPGAENRAFLERLIGARGRFGLRLESRGIRAAAEQALAAHRGPRSMA